jgi:hypothetical protein
MSLANRAFGAITKRFDSRAKDIAMMARTGYSFEEWCNWESFLACRQLGEDIDVFPRPQYCEHGVADCKDYGDLLLICKDQKLLIEIGIVHDETGDKWIEKLDNDMRKLERLTKGGTRSLQVILLASKFKIRDNPKWQKWLARTDRWTRPTTLEHFPESEPPGEIVLRGWSNDC